MAGEKILVVDDEKLIVELCRRILVKKDYEVSAAYSGPHALEICEKGPIDVLLTDIKMPAFSKTSRRPIWIPSKPWGVLLRPRTWRPRVIPTVQSRWL